MKYIYVIIAIALAIVFSLFWKGINYVPSQPEENLPVDGVPFYPCEDKCS